MELITNGLKQDMNTSAIENQRKNGGVRENPSQLEFPEFYKG